jgi:hypothetical protein
MTIEVERCEGCGNPWVLITGGVHADIGKGSLAAVLGRLIANASAADVSYMKFDPSLEELSIAEYSNTRFGEIVQESTGNCYDADVARARFYIPGFTPSVSSHISLRQLLESTNAGGRKASVGHSLRNLVKDDAWHQNNLGRESQGFSLPAEPRGGLKTRVIEVGGTAGRGIISAISPRIMNL